MKRGVKKRLKVASVLGSLGLTTLGLTGCYENLEKEQENINSIILDKLNTDENSKCNIGGNFDSYSFLESDIEKSSDEKYSVAINGISYSKESNRQALTSLNYVVDDSYFLGVGDSNKKLINALANIVENEKSNFITINKVNDINAFNNSLLSCECEKISYVNNFLYNVKNLEIDENYASFNAESVAKYCYVVPAGPTFLSSSHYINEKVKINLTKEESEIAKQDEAYVFDKFTECVNSKQNDNYTVTMESCENYKDLSVFNFDYEKCIEK